MIHTTLVTIVLLWLSAMDILSGRIPPVLLMLLLLIGVIQHLMTGLHWLQLVLIFTIAILGKVFDRYAPGMLGWGDIKLMAALVLVYSIYAWYLTMLTALCIALLFGAGQYLIQRTRGHGQEGICIPLAPFLFMASLITFQYTVFQG